MGRHCTSEQIDFLAENMIGRSQRELTEMFNARFNLQKSVSQIHSILKYHRRKNGVSKKLHHYTKEQIDFLAENMIGRSQVN